MARFGLTYDVTFLSVLLHNLANCDITINKERCVSHPIRRRGIAAPDEISEKSAALNVILCYYKALDDFTDTGKRSVKSAVFQNGYKRAKKKYPEIERMAAKRYGDLTNYEKSKTSSVDMVADPFSKLSAEFSSFVLGDSATEDTYKIFYFIGKWIYIIDAIDDFDKDKKRNEYNVFACAFPDCVSGEQLIKEHGNDVFSTLNSVFYHLKEGVENAKFYFNKDLIENVLLRGIPKQTDAVLKKYLKEKEN